DRLRLLDLAVAPLADLLRARERDPDGGERKRVLRLLAGIEDVLHDRSSLNRWCPLRRVRPRRRPAARAPPGLCREIAERKSVVSAVRRPCRSGGCLNPPSTRPRSCASAQAAAPRAAPRRAPGTGAP